MNAMNLNLKYILKDKLVNALYVANVSALKIEKNMEGNDMIYLSIEKTHFKRSPRNGFFRNDGPPLEKLCSKMGCFLNILHFGIFHQNLTI